MKIVAIGAGSYVFGPSVLAQTYLEQKLDNVHLALVDPDIETIELVAGVGRRMARDRGLRTTITTHADRAEALGGADFVISTASPQMQRRNAMDSAIIDEYLPGHLKTEFGGIAGISYSLRQIALTEAITTDMKRLCPGAWLLNISNPLPRVTQAASENGIRTAGFCVVSVSAYSTLWQIFHDTWLDFPFTEAKDAWKITTAGLNHFAWLVEFKDRQTDEDLLPELRRRLDSNKIAVNPLSQHYFRETGYMLVPSDEHTRDFLAPIGPNPEHAENPWHGSPEQRKQRHEMLRLVGEGERPWDEILQSVAWEKPLEFISALSGGGAADFHSMNLLNDSGQISNLPRTVFVETPCHVESEMVSPKSITLPESVLPLCERTLTVTDTIVRAARQRSMVLVHEAVKLDPTILDKAAGLKAIDACLAAHADILPTYA